MDGLNLDPTSADQTAADDAATDIATHTADAKTTNIAGVTTIVVDGSF